MGVFGAGNKKSGKLTLDKVAEIRQLYGQGATQGHLCGLFDVSVNTIGRIVRGESWREGAALREPTQEELKASRLRTMALVAQIEREKAFEVETGYASPPNTQPGPAAAKFEDALLSDHVKAMRDKLLGYDEESKRASPPPSLLDGGDAPAEVAGQGLARLEEAAQTEGLDVEVALRRSST